MKTAVILATGPSLRLADCRYARAHADIVIAVNDAWRLCPEADILYAADCKWWAHHGEMVNRLFPGRKETLALPIENGRPAGKLAAEKFGAKWLWSMPGAGISIDPAFVYDGGNSTYQAMQRAIHEGASRIVFLGLDMQKSGDGKRHFFGSHPPAMDLDSPYGTFIKNFEQGAKIVGAMGIDVINASRETALECFPRMGLEEALNAADMLRGTG